MVMALSDKCLIHRCVKAMILGLDNDFTCLLKEEIKREKLPLEQYEISKVKDVI